MAEPKLLPWRKMWEFIGACAESSDLPGMMQRAVQSLPRLVSCEHAIACLVTANHAHNNVAVRAANMGAPEQAIRAYCERWYHEDVARLTMDRSTPIYEVDWRGALLQPYPFTREFIRGLMRIDLSAGIPMWAEDGLGGFVVLITRVGVHRISGRDEGILRALRPHLVNLYSLHTRIAELPADHYLAAELARESELLSRREAEIAGLLCKRLCVHEIAALLMISTRTVETHIQHVYAKLHVNNRAELLHRLLS